jgi:hypothetical protein
MIACPFLHYVGVALLCIGSAALLGYIKGSILRRRGDSDQ